MKSPSRALAVSRENAYEATKFTFVMPRTGLAFCDVSFTCSALYADRPIGKSIWFAPTLALIPGKAAPVSVVRPVAGAPRLPRKPEPESRPCAAKSKIVVGAALGIVGGFAEWSPGQAAIAWSIVLTPQAFSVAAMAFCAAVVFRYRASPTWFVS